MLTRSYAPGSVGSMVRSRTYSLYAAAPQSTPTDGTYAAAAWNDAKRPSGEIHGPRPNVGDPLTGHALIGFVVSVHRSRTHVVKLKASKATKCPSSLIDGDSVVNVNCVPSG